RDFDPATDQRTVRMGVNQQAEAMLAAPLCELLEREAPNLRLSILTLFRRDMVAQIQGRTLDLGVGRFYNDVGGLAKENLYSEVLSVVARKRHPQVGSRLTRKVYTTCQHVAVSSSPESGMLERQYASLGVYRNVAMIIPRYHSAFRAVARSNRLLTV